MHRQIMGPHPTKRCIDHKNGNKLDNRKENLRFATDAENMRNSKKKANSTGLHGIHWDKERKRYYAQIRTTEGKKKHLGRYKRKNEAIKAYNKAAKEYHGEFATYNVFLTKGKKRKILEVND